MTKQTGDLRILGAADGYAHALISLRSGWIGPLVRPGPRPEGHQAAHSCGRGHDGCFHPKHLSWKTISNNLMDRREHGTVRANPNGQNGLLTEADVVEVRALKGYISQYEIARMFGVGRAAIQYWHKHDRPRAAFLPGTSRSNIWQRKKRAELASSV